jgi:hypothetical protein
MSAEVLTYGVSKKQKTRYRFEPSPEKAAVRLGGKSGSPVDVK